MDRDRKIDVYTHVGPNEKKSSLVSIEFEKRGTSGPILEIIPSTFKIETKKHDIETLYMCPLPVDVKIEPEEMIPENSDGEDGSDGQGENDDQDGNDGQDEDDQDEDMNDEGETNIADDDLEDPNPVQTAYFDYFKGLYPDYAKLDPGRKELFRCTLDRLIKEQSLG